MVQHMIIRSISKVILKVSCWQMLKWLDIVCKLLASERSERDTYRGKNEKIGDVYLYICLDVRMSFCTLTLAFLC